MAANLKDFNKNIKRSKKREFNNYGVVTELVRSYKELPREELLIEIIKNLEGIINSYTFILSPPDKNQAMYVTPYMKRVLGMFLTPDERARSSNEVYNQAAQRVRWITRNYSYEDIYAKVVEIIISVVKSMKVIGNCDCIYFIQMMVRYRMYEMIVKTGKDATTYIIQFDEDENNDESSVGEQIDKTHYEEFSDVDPEWDIIESCFYDDITLSTLLEEHDVFRRMNYYDKFLLYLRNGLNLKYIQIANILKYDLDKDIRNYYSIIDGKLLESSEEHLFV